jgi:uncharacterized RDD family membrane protein YckC
MVLGDLGSKKDSSRFAYREFEPIENRSMKVYLAGPWDRLAAIVIDSIILVPLLSLLLAPLRKSILSAQILGSSTEISYAYLLFVMMIAGLIAVYSTVFTIFFGGTPGKLFTGLRIISVWTGKKPIPISAFLRSLFWVIDCICIFPLAALFHDKRSRPLHDRVAETVVISVRKKITAHPPTWVEVSLGRSIMAFGFIFLFAWLCVVAMKLHKSLGGDGDILASLQDEGLLCEPVGRYIGAINEDSPMPDRIEVAMSMFAAEEIDVDCLEKEAEFQTYKGQEQPLLYLAKAFVHSHDPSKSDRYLEKVCSTEKKSDACLLTELMELWTTTQNYSFDREQELEAKIEKASDFVKIWSIRHFIKVEDYEKASGLLTELNHRDMVKQFIADQWPRLSLLMGKKNESQLLAEMALSVLDESSRWSLIGWLCYEEQVDGCQAKSHCSQMKSIQADPEKVAQDPFYTVGLIRQGQCQHDASIIGRNFRENLNPQAMGLVLAFEASENNEPERAKELYTRLIENNVESAQELYVWEAHRRLIGMAANKEDLVVVSEKLLEVDHLNRHLRRLSEVLVKKYMEIGQPRLALEWGLEFREKMGASDEFDQLLAVSAAKSNQPDIAARLSIKNSERKPASEKDEEL